MKLKNLTDLFIFELRGMHDAENQLIEALPKMAQAARDPNLKKAFENHLQETAHHVSRIDEILDILGLPHQDEPNAPMKALIAQGAEVIRDAGDDRAINAALIAAAQKVEHFEIASYGTLIALARELGYDNAVVILKQTIEEEKAADEKLTDLAQSGINHDALKKAA